MARCSRSPTSPSELKRHDLSRWERGRRPFIRLCPLEPSLLSAIKGFLSPPLKTCDKTNRPLLLPLASPLDITSSSLQPSPRPRTLGGRARCDQVSLCFRLQSCVDSRPSPTLLSLRCDLQVPVRARVRPSGTQPDESPGSPAPPCKARTLNSIPEAHRLSTRPTRNVPPSPQRSKQVGTPPT